MQMCTYMRTHRGMGVSGRELWLAASSRKPPLTSPWAGLPQPHLGLGSHNLPLLVGHLCSSWLAVPG